MATFTGTGANEIITPGAISLSVSRSPAGSFPSAAADLLIGGDGNDTLDGGGGSDTAFGGGGDDLIFAVLGTPEQIGGGTGVDTLDTTLFAGDYLVNLATGATNFTGESFINMENIVSGAGDNTLLGTAGANVMNGGAGNDSIDGGGGNDSLTGGDGNDTLNGGGGADTALGGNGDDLIFAVFGTPESIDGGAGVDTLDTTAFAGDYLVNLATGTTNFLGESFVNMEHIVSGIGNDTLVGTAAANVMNGGVGNDSVDGGGGNDSLIGGDGDDTLNGAGGADTLGGGAGADTLDGGGGNDRLNGGGGDDRLKGGSGDDLLVGGVGDDTLDGGAGADTIAFLTSGEGVDRIVGWQAGADLLRIDASGFGGGLAAGALAAGRLVVHASNNATSAAGTGQFVFNSATSTLLWDGDGMGGAGAQSLAVLVGVGSLASTDFFIVS